MESQGKQSSTQQRQWSADQRRQQIAELLRNKGVICHEYLVRGSCPRSPTCPYMHVANGETRPVPWSICTFFAQGKCLRDRCTFFHGPQTQLEELHATGSPVYRPQDYMKIVIPPHEYVNQDGSIATNISPKNLQTPPSPVEVMARSAAPLKNPVNPYPSVLVMPQGSQSISPNTYARQTNTPNTSATQFPFYTGQPLPMQATAMFSQELQPVQAAAYYPAGNIPLPPSVQGYGGPQQYNIPQQQHHQQPNHFYFQIQPQ